MKIKNPWKIACCIVSVVAVLLLIVLGSLVWYATRPVELGDDFKVAHIEEGDASFQVNLTKEQVNVMIQEYLADKQGVDTTFSMYLDEELVIVGAVEVYGFTIEMTTYLTPELQEDGSIYFEVESVNVGFLTVPINMILSFIEASGVLPDYAVVDEEGIWFDVSQIESESGMTFKVQELNLAEDSIIIDVYKR